MSDERVPKETISLALPMAGGVEPHTAGSWMEVVHYDGRFGGQHLHYNRPFLRVAGATVTNARNELVRQFLEQPEDNQADWLLFLDDDQMYPEYLLEMLMASVDPKERRIVALPVWRFISNNGGPVRVTHNVFDLDDGGGIIEWTEPFPQDALIQVPAVGTGCMMIHRSALEDIQTVAQANGFGAKWCWFLERVYLPADVKEGEDIWFCRMATAAGIPIFVNTSITLQHAKTIMLQGFAPEGSLSIGGEPGWFHKQADAVRPIHDTPVDVIIPVLHRPQNIKPLMDSLKATAPNATAWFVTEPNDVIVWAEVKNQGGELLVHPGTFAEKVNHGYTQTSAEFMVVVGDDVKFHPGWLNEALHAAATTGKSVIGTNDLGNPRVKRGDHAVHFMIRRSYIDETGASWDGPGVVCHEGYRHCYVDDEIITAAKQRDKWQPCLTSVVEHLHPYFGKAEHDDTYKLGESAMKADQKLFKQRFMESTK
jgi:hypothetical protein